MNKALVLTVLLGVAALAGVLYTTQQKTGSFLRTTDLKYKNEFLRFKEHYQKTYGSDEGFFRYTNYAANMDIVAAQNALYDAGNSTFFLGENQYADLSLAEFKAQLLGYKRNTAKTVTVPSKVTVTALPAAVDWTNKGAVNPVKNQQQCGSCWAFSAVSALESLNFLKNGNLVSFSEQSVVDCSDSYGNQGCNGGLMDQAFQYVAAEGIPTEASYPYTAADGTCQSFTSVFKNTGFTDVTVNNDNALATAIAQQPVSVAIEADTSAFQLYAGGILNDSSCGTALDHGVTAVGYGSGFWKIRNSWGDSWGEAGYVRLARTGDDAGMCGVQSDASYPTL